MFFNTGNLFYLITGLISLLGFLILLFSKKSKELSFIPLLFISNFIVLEHHLITRPLMDYWFNPSKLYLLGFFMPVFFVVGVIFIAKQILKKINYNHVAIGIIILLLIPSIYLKYDGFSESQWVLYGMEESEYIDELYYLGDWMSSHVTNYETILSNDETGFMLAMVSGKKVMLTRRTHASYFIDIDQRIAEASVAMYGDNLNETLRVLNEYDVNYLYLDTYLLSSPMRVRPDLAEYLDDYNIEYEEVYDRYDVAVPPESAYMQDLLLISPLNITETFLDLWDKVYVVEVEGSVVAEMYELKEEYQN